LYENGTKLKKNMQLKAHPASSNRNPMCCTDFVNEHVLKHDSAKCKWMQNWKYSNNTWIYASQS